MPSAAISMLEGSLAAMGAAMVSTPFEVVKIRLQLQGELQAASSGNRVYKGTLPGLYLIAKNEGMKGPYRGLGAALVYQFAMNGIRLGLYDTFKESINGVISNAFIASVCAASSLGFVSSYVTSPLFLVKTRLQANSHGAVIKVGSQYQYKHLVDGLRCIYREQGTAGLWHGAYLAAVRTAMGSTVQLGMYDVLKSSIGRQFDLRADDQRLHVLSSLTTSACVAVTMNPFDVIMTREYNNANNQYSANFFRSFQKIVVTEGVAGVFKGTGALWGRIGPHTVCSLVFLERIRRCRKDWFPDWD